MIPNNNRPLVIAKNNSFGSSALKPASVAIAAISIFLVGYVITGEYRSWPESLQLSSWLVLPAMIAIWGIALSRVVSPIRRSAAGRPEASPGPCFLKELRRERLRADRSRTPLSIAIFSFENKNDELRDNQAQQFLNFLHTTIRDTDVVGQLGGSRIGLLLIDTDAKGRKSYIKKLIDGYGELPVSVVTATYPNQIFDNLADEHQDCPEPCPFFLDADQPEHPGYVSKRLVDIIGASVAILIFSPLMLLTLIAIKATSPGPVIFRQMRLGRNGRPFVFYKFRSMAWMADDRVHRDYVTSLIKGNAQAINQGDAAMPLYKLKADPRVTSVGRIIRKTSIDELPQLFNVLKGDMSLVGPRPPLPYEAENYQSWHLRRIFGIKPGITGLWQVEGRCRTTFDDMVRLDLEYIDNCSLMLDLRILFRTVKVVLHGAGAA
jgi:exopolysaccharide biosynthesis polyprenyl glycosylphosphotransferase